MIFNLAVNVMFNFLAPLTMLHQADTMLFRAERQILLATRRHERQVSVGYSIPQHLCVLL